MNYMSPFTQLSFQVLSRISKKRESGSLGVSCIYYIGHIAPHSFDGSNWCNMRVLYTFNGFLIVVLCMH